MLPGVLLLLGMMMILMMRSTTDKDGTIFNLLGELGDAGFQARGVDDAADELVMIGVGAEAGKGSEVAFDDALVFPSRPFSSPSGPFIQETPVDDETFTSFPVI